MKAYGFSNVYFLLRKAIEGIRIPDQLEAYEQVYIRRFVESRGYKVVIIEGNGFHYNELPDNKRAWLGTGSRVIGNERPRHVSKVLARRIVTARVKAIPPAIASQRPIDNNTKHSILAQIP